MSAAAPICLLGFDQEFIGGLLCQRSDLKLRLGLLTSEEVEEAKQSLDELGVRCVYDSGWGVYRYTDDDGMEITLFQRHLDPAMGFSWPVFLSGISTVFVTYPHMAPVHQQDLARCIARYRPDVKSEFIGNEPEDWVQQNRPPVPRPLHLIATA